MIAGRLIRLLKLQPLWSNHSGRSSLCRHCKLLSSSTIQMFKNEDSLAPSFILPPVAPKTAPINTDLLTEQIEQAKTTERVLKLASLHHEVMNNTHLSAAFEALYRCEKDNRISQDIISQPAFLSLCNQTMKRVRFFVKSDVITIFKVLSFVGVPSTAALMQALCQMLRHSINDLSLRDITFLDYMLSKQQSTPLVEALIIALPLVLDAQLERQLDPYDLGEVTSCLVMATKRNMNYSTVEKLAKYALQKKQHLSVRNAFAVMKSLTVYRPLQDSIEQLLRECQDILSQNIHTLSEPEILAILSDERLPDARRLYHKNLYTTLVQRAVTEQWELWKLCKLLGLLNKCEMVAPSILDLVAETIADSPDKMEMDDKLSLFLLIEGFAIPGYQPRLAGTVRDTIVHCSDKARLLQARAPKLFLKFMKNLAVMQWCDNRLLTMALDHQFLRYKIRFNPDKDWSLQIYQDLLRLEQYARQQAADYTGPFLPENIFRDACIAVANSKADAIFPLQPHLEIALGGSQFVKTAMWTQYGQFIDHVIVMRKGNFPMSICNSPDHSMQTMEFVENLPELQDAVVVAILVAERQHYCQEPPILRGDVKADLVILKKQGYHPVLINLENWYELLDHEKIPYLMREIRDITDEATFGRNISPLGA